MTATPGPEAPISALPKLHELEASLNAVIRGKSDVIRLSVVCLLLRGHLLIEDVPGVTVYNAGSGEFEFKPVSVFTNFLLADEINRATPKTQSALLEAMSEPTPSPTSCASLRAIRCPTIKGTVNPLRDIEDVDLELVFSDLVVVEKRNASSNCWKSPKSSWTRASPSAPGISKVRTKSSSVVFSSFRSSPSST